MSYYSIYLLGLYFLAICAVFLTKFIRGNTGNIFAVAIAFITFVLAAFRPIFFPDVDSYELIFEHAASGAFDDPIYWAAHGEPGFKILSYLLSLTGLGYRGYLVVWSLVSWLLLLLISRISSISFAYLWLAYFSFHFITRDLGVIRLGLASHLIVIFFIQRAFIWQAVTLFIASLTFQIFAVVAVLARLFSRFKIDWFSISLLFLVSFASIKIFNFETLEFLIPEKQAGTYTRSSLSGSGGLSIVVPVVRNISVAFFLYYFMRSEIKFRYFRVWIWAVFFSASFYIMASEILIVAQRFSAYFGAIVPLAMAYLMQRRANTQHTFFLVVLFALANFAALFYFNDFLWRPELQRCYADGLDYRPGLEIGC